MKTLKSILLFLFVVVSTNCSAQLLTEFNRESPSGHILRYTVTSDTTVKVKNGYGSIIGNLVIPDTVSNNNTIYRVTETSWYAFQGQTGMVSVTLPNSLSIIGISSFEGCTSLASVYLGNSVDIIEDASFKDCHSLTTINFPTIMNRIGSNAFMDCRMLDSIVLPPGIVQIYYRTFYNDSSLSHIVIPGSVNTIDVSAFENCVGMEYIEIPNSVDSIAESAFIHSGLKTIRIPDSLRVIQSFTFRLCENLDSVFLGESVEKIEGQAFEQCHNLKYIGMNNYIKQIGSYAFGWCDGLTSITLPRTIQYIGDGAFSTCESLHHVEYNADSCARVGWYGQSPCEYCTSLATAVIGENVRYVPSNTFKGCSSLDEIYVKPIVSPILGDSVFANISNTATFYIPCNTYNQYRNNWGNLNFIEPTVDYVVTVNENESSMGSAQMIGTISCADSSAHFMATPNNGYRFDHWSTGATDNPYTAIITSDTTITAYFSVVNTENIDIVGTDGVNVWSKDGNIIVEGCEQCKLQVFDMMGRQVKNQSLSVGVYMVKVGSLPVRKVVVVR